MIHGALWRQDTALTSDTLLVRTPYAQYAVYILNTDETDVVPFTVRIFTPGPPRGGQEVLASHTNSRRARL